MCDTTAFVLRDGREEKILENVERIETDGDQLTLTNIYGESESLRGRLRLFDNSGGKLVIEPI